MTAKMRDAVRAVRDLLLAHDDILILGHQKPDGDAYGAAFALLWALERLGKRARVETCGGYDPRYRFLFGDYLPAAFEPSFVVTADVAGPALLGSLKERWAGRVDLCVDHHQANNLQAAHKLVVPETPATCQLVYHIIKELAVPFDARMAGAIFTGLSTDTGGFLFDNVTAETHRIAAGMIEAGADHGLINRLMFDTISRARLALDRRVMDTLEYFFGGLCALITITARTVAETGVADSELDGVSSLPRRIEGVLAGVTLKEKADGSAWRVSLRTRGALDAAAICLALGGGGHRNAAGCTLPGPAQDAKRTILAKIEAALKELGYPC